MDLFAAAGIDIGDGGRGGRRGRSAIGRTLKLPLLKYKVVADALEAFRQRTPFGLTDRQVDAAAAYAKTVKSRAFVRMKETAVRPLFCEKVLGEFLGYTQINPAGPYSLAFEAPLGRGSVDVALGRFGLPDGGRQIAAPFELKGPAIDLDAIMPGRGRSPVQQAWDYANDAPGCRWVLVSNCVELRLYGFGRGREAYELFDLTKLDEPREQERLWFLLSAERLLGGATEALLRATDAAYKTITDELYVQYKGLRERLLQFLTDATDGPKLGLAAALEPAQKILDRILFIAFAQRTALLPDQLLERALKAQNEFRPEPIWRNFVGLFRGVDQGNPKLNIWPFNGGLFAHDPAVDAIELPDELATGLASLGAWDYRDDVPVTLLGHLFEQSITDLEALRAESRGEEAPKVSKRKREGVVYTPDIVTRFLVERTIGVTLAERRAAIFAAHGKTPPENGDPIFADGEEETERAVWRDYLAALRGLRVVDPACGSGAFLVAAFDLLVAEYRGVLERLHALAEPPDCDPFDEILTKNLYGVDLNAESVEITRLALWLKTARSQHRLQNLEGTIKVGDSLIEDAKYTAHPFDWRQAFPDVFAVGGFDVVIGNPPYVRMELIKSIKPYLEKHYVVAADRADLYAYFFERGVDLLKDGGRLGYISSSTFFRTGSGENLRTFLGDRAAIETVVDFGDLQIFEGVTTYPAIVTLRKGEADDGGRLRFLKVDELPGDLQAEFAAQAIAVPRARLVPSSWQFEDEPLAKLRDKIVKGRKTLGEVYGAPLYGIKTGLNDAFIVDTATRDRLVKQDPKSAELLVPFLRGENVKRWRVEPEGLFLINTPKGKVDIERYPAIRDWLLPFRKQLETRATKQEWFELQQAQLAYQPKFVSGGVIFPDVSQGPKFALIERGNMLDCTVFLLEDSHPELVAYLNSKLSWFFLFAISNPLRGGTWRLRMKSQYIERLPVPDTKKLGATRLEFLSSTCGQAASQSHRMIEAVLHRVQMDFTSGAAVRLSRKLHEWWTLDFAAFRAEVKRVFRTDIPVKERGDWESYLAEQGAAVRKLTAEIEAAEREIDAIVYRLFDLTPAEIALLESSIAGQY